LETASADVQETVKKMISSLESSFKEQKAKEIENLYNAIATAISSQPNAHISNILTALELIKAEIVDQKLNAIRQEQANQGQ
jgi:cobalamin biosynthesis protein CbiD